MKTCIAIIGPTAVGKTSIAVQIARHFNTKIISCDSRQCYRELGIGVAKPSREELNLVHHYFINSHSIFDEVNAAVFEQYALNAIGEIFEENDIAVMVGGTGLYVKAFCDGIDEVPVIDDSIRKQIVSEYESKGMEWLSNEVAKRDPLFFAKGEIKNPQRMMRALEVKLSTGNSIIEFHKKESKTRNFNIIKTGLELPREKLVANINARVDKMMEEGLLKEVEGLRPYQNLNALQTVGYREIFDHFDGKTSLEDAIEAIKINTRQYAKRQMTWFRKDKEIKWCEPDLESVADTLKLKGNLD